MHLKPFAIPAALLLACLGLACSKPATPNNQSQTGQVAAPAAASESTASPAPSDPIQKAVYTYLQDVRQLNLSKMDVAVTDQKIEGDKATCDVTFTVKGGGMTPMEYTYDLVQESGAWKVTSSKSKSGAHGGGMPPGTGEMPPGHPAMGGEGAPSGMPAHGDTTGLPAGHPPVDAQPAPAPAPAAAPKAN